MKRSLIIGLAVALVLVLFAVKNNEIISINFILGNPVKGHLSLVLLIVLIIGVCIGILFSYPSYRKLKKTISEKEKEISKLTKGFADYNNKTKDIMPPKS
ncbi:MAG: hypothetical protein A2X13_11705 [Bacteroidetes bacterium GWC2_33_15]|nr:MAG: hypothetical protein A2X10_05730 [Bacteroidetes bacterium GWA2_33_15]OFX50803.1 MAG: hypothetical protein A2X13_11705 [Bacteroidetes bacterium GWC2_33_15]OFX62914.1 MAG: hypothetical protein A2X15_09665 [Bacteroidetes bacterium GWB2_32_14]OFX69984.1 MAG: hypothetical protein A2X14_02525 [Bacteroidetes bacterium GWD2_33_33]HAN18980.1 hypothetical protein [Bacteroidales bacterium]